MTFNKQINKFTKHQKPFFLSRALNSRPVKSSLLTILLVFPLVFLQAQPELIFVRLKYDDPKVGAYTDDQINKAVFLEEYKPRYLACAPGLKKYFNLKNHEDIINKPSQNAFLSYLSALERRDGEGLYSYAGELMPGNKYMAGEYMNAMEDYNKYQKIGIDLRDQSANTFTSIFGWYRDLRLQGHQAGYVMEKISAADFNTLRSFLQNRWAGKLAPNTDYVKLIEDLYEVQLMVYMEKRLASNFAPVLNAVSGTVPDCTAILLKALQEVSGKEKLESLVTPGIYSDAYSTVNIFDVHGGTLRASFEYKVEEATGKGFWINCKIEGNRITGEWTAEHDDKTKSGTRKGTLTATVNGNTITGEYIEDTPSWNYKPGYSAANVSSRMVKGKIWPFTLKKR